MEGYERISKFIWAINMHNCYCMPVKSKVAFIGDVAMAIDPLSATGCAFAFQSAKMLFEITKNVIKVQTLLATALNEYAVRHTETFMPHFEGISAHSALKSTYSQKSFYDMIVNNKELSAQYLKLVGRLITPSAFQSFFINSMTVATY